MMRIRTVELLEDECSRLPFANPLSCNPVPVRIASKKPGCYTQSKPLLKLGQK